MPGSYIILYLPGTVIGKKQKQKNTVCELSSHRVCVSNVKDLGIQFTRAGAVGLQTSKFIAQHSVVDVIINKVIAMVCTILLILLNIIYVSVIK